jgi:hypothetical protein
LNNGINYQMAKLNSPCGVCGQLISVDFSKLATRIYWNARATDQGTVIGTDWSGVNISWDDGDTNTVRKRARVTRDLQIRRAIDGVCYDILMEISTATAKRADQFER